MEQQDPGGQPPDQRPPAYTGPFLFVNKNASNLKSREREEVFAVRSHAMQIARRSRKPSSHGASTSSKEQKANENPSAESTRGSTNPDLRGRVRSVSAEQIPSIDDLLDQQAQRLLQYQQRRSQGGRASQSRSQLPVHSPQEGAAGSASPIAGPFSANSPSTPISQDQMTALAQYLLASRPITAVSGGNSDPFDAAALPINAFFSSLIQFWRVGYMSNFWPPHIYLNPTHRTSQMTDSWIRSMVVQNPAMLHGLFAGSLSFATNYLPQTGETPLLWARGIHHHGKCLEETRARLAQPSVPHEEALSMIQQTMCFSFHCQDLDSCQVHRIAAMKLFENLDRGLDSLHPVLKHLLVLCDSLVAGHVPKRTSFDAAAWAPPSWAEDDSLRPFDELFTFDAQIHRPNDIAVCLLVEDGLEDTTYCPGLLDLLTLHREALAANELAFSLSNTPGSPLTGIPAPASGSRRERADPIYNWLSLRQYALNCFSANMYIDIVESEDQEKPLASRLRRVFHSCILLATSYMFQFTMRSTMNVTSMGYIPYHHLRTRLELLMTLMSQFRRTQTAVGGGINPIPTDALLFLFFCGAALEEYDAPNRRMSSQQTAQTGFNPSPVSEHPGDFLDEHWFSMHFAMVLERMGLQNWEAARSILRRFLYVDRVLDRFVQVLFTRKLEFLAALVAGPASSSAVGIPGGMTAGATDPYPGLMATGQQHRGSLQGMDMPVAAPVSLAGLSTEHINPILGPTPISLGTTAPQFAAAWWWDDLDAGEPFELDMDMEVPMDREIGSGGPSRGSGGSGHESQETGGPEGDEQLQIFDEAVRLKERDDERYGSLWE